MLDTPFVVLDSIAIFLVVVPMPWHMSAWNSATCYMMIWTVLGCIIHLVNALVWAGNLSNPSPIYCDISTKIQIGISIAIPLSSLCINRRLYNIATMKSVTIGREQKKRDVLIDTLVAVLCPMIFMAVHYTQQGHRYDIVEDFGCWPTTYLTIPSYILVIAPPIIVCSISLVFCTLSIRAFLKRRHDFNAVLRSSTKNLNSHRYFRLMALATAEIVIGLPSSLYFLITNLKETGVNPWISWDDTHWDFNRIVFYPAYVFKVQPGLLVAFEFNRWSLPFIAFLFFAFFGLADEAFNNYKRAYYAVLRPFGVTRPATVNTSSTGSAFGKAGAHRVRGLSTPKLREDLDVDILPPRYYASTQDPFTPESPSYAPSSMSPLPSEHGEKDHDRRDSSWALDSSPLTPSMLHDVLVPKEGLGVHDAPMTAASSSFDLQSTIEDPHTCHALPHSLPRHRDASDHV